MRGSFEERFWAKVNKKRRKQCWLWTASIRGGGYGQIAVGDGTGKINDAHRASWELAYGPIKKGLFVLHKCDVRACVNPNHLFLGTHQDNIDDMMSKGRGRNRVFKGEDNGTAILTDNKVKEIRTIYAKGQSSCVKLGRLYGVGSSTIHRVVTGTHWKHVA